MEYPVKEERAECIVLFEVGNEHPPQSVDSRRGNQVLRSDCSLTPDAESSQVKEAFEFEHKQSALVREEEGAFYVSEGVLNLNYEFEVG